MEPSRAIGITLGKVRLECTSIAQSAAAAAALRIKTSWARPLNPGVDSKGRIHENKLGHYYGRVPCNSGSCEPRQVRKEATVTRMLCDMGLPGHFSVRIASLRSFS